jgi:hypothetical protein
MLRLARFDRLIGSPGASLSSGRPPTSTVRSIQRTTSSGWNVAVRLPPSRLPGSGYGRPGGAGYVTSLAFRYRFLRDPRCSRLATGSTLCFGCLPKELHEADASDCGRYQCSRALGDAGSGTVSKMETLIRTIPSSSTTARSGHPGPNGAHDCGDAHALPRLISAGMEALSSRHTCRSRAWSRSTGNDNRPPPTLVEPPNTSSEGRRYS